jgi:hypothetical protein
MPLQTELVDWLMRVEAEYREMPGLQLTSGRQRLWVWMAGPARPSSGLRPRGVLGTPTQLCFGGQLK